MKIQLAMGMLCFFAGMMCVEVKQLSILFDCIRSVHWCLFYVQCIVGGGGGIYVFVVSTFHLHFISD